MTDAACFGGYWGGCVIVCEWEELEKLLRVQFGSATGKESYKRHCKQKPNIQETPVRWAFVTELTEFCRQGGKALLAAGWRRTNHDSLEARIQM